MKNKTLPHKKYEHAYDILAFLAQAEGFAPLAARPARQLSIAAFALILIVIQFS